MITYFAHFGFSVIDEGNKREKKRKLAYFSQLCSTATHDPSPKE